MNLNDRRLLGFEGAVHTLLEPLLNRYGFIRAAESPEAVRFESPHVSLTLFHQSLSYELDLVVILKDRLDEHFTLQDVVESGGGAEPAFFQASSADRVRQCVASITRLLQKYGDGVLHGEADSFSRMKEVSEHRSQELTTAVVNRPIREAAELAWKDGNYDEVKRLYETIRGGLAETESKRLEYATKHLKTVQ